MKKEIIINLLFTFIISIFTFFNNKFFIEYLGIEKLGIFKVFLEILQYLNLAEMGLEGVGSYYLYGPLAEKQQLKVSLVMTSIEKIYKNISKFILILGILVLPILQIFVKKIDFETYLIWIVLVFNTVLTYFYMKYILLFIADQKIFFVKFVQGSSKIFSQILQVIFIIKVRSFLGYSIMLLIDVLIQFYIFKRYYFKNYPYIIRTKETLKEINNGLKNNFFHKISAVILYNSDVLLIARYLNITIVGIYSNYRMILNLLLTIERVILGIIRPRLGKKMVTLSKDDIYKDWNKNNIYFLLFSLYGAINIKILINPFLELWLGERYILDDKTVVFFSLISFIELYRSGIELYKECCGYFSDIHLSIIESILNLVLSIIFIKIYKLNGVLLGTIISTIVIRLIMRHILVYKECFSQSVKEYFKFLLIQISYSTIIILFIKYCTAKFINIDSWKLWLYTGVYTLVIYLILGVLIFYFNKKLINFYYK